MRSAFVGYSCHRTTLLSQWFIETLRKNASLEEFWLDEDAHKPSLDFNLLIEFDMIYVLQIEHIARRLAVANSSKVVFVPMFDSCRHLPAEWWAPFRHSRVISFSWTLHERLRRWGVNSFQTQYFPDPSNYAVVTDFTNLRGFLWQRQQAIGLLEAEKLSRSISWDHFHWHVGMDQGQGDINPPDFMRMRRMNVTYTRSSGNGENNPNLTHNANIFFAPRLRESIGISFLEAMARGQCVVAPSAPTMSEYIDHRVTGLTYDPGNLVALDFSNAANIGAAARRRIERGFEDWTYDRDIRIPDILFDRSGLSAPRTRAQAEWSTSPAIIEARQRRSNPKITVAMVVLNAADTIEGTILSVIEQTFIDFELIVVDGGSTDNTLKIIESYRSFISVFISEPDNGIYDAMNKAARLGCGEYIIFMNAGDMFASRRSIERAFGGRPDDADIVFGNNISLPDSGSERFHQASEFDKTWNLLRTGNLSFSWLMSIPVHQAVFTRRTLLLAQGGFSSEFRIAADHELMYRLKNANAKFHHCGEVIAIYAGGGLSARREKECLQDWWRIARLYGERRGVDHFFRNQFSPKNEIGPWTPDVMLGWLIRSLKRMGRRWNRSLMKAHRRRLAKRHAHEPDAPLQL